MQRPLTENRGLRIGLWILAVLSLLAFVGVLAAHADSVYTPLTVEQAQNYMTAVGPAEVVQEIIKLDWLEHTVPVAKVPPSLVAVHGSDVSIAWQGALTLSVPFMPGFALPMPVYSVTLADETYKGVVPGLNRDTLVEVGALGVAVGVVVTLLIRGL